MIIPQYMNLIDWSASLLIDFPFDTIPILYREDEWKDWGNQLILSDSFYQAGAPGTSAYSDPMEWAYAVYLTMLDNA